ncbi:ABC transporter substrate-binding protein [Arthrobacter sp. 35W]|uniref:ABC transporter substrate-binding protein n=1 Tax=Arthrobacter sp. 35W TaxID=1132441 RepID=UPI00040617C7|nr:ABC transporter substrate-binding protein [Arthrobacter sp. 35W]
MHTGKTRGPKALALGLAALLLAGCSAPTPAPSPSSSASASAVPLIVTAGPVPDAANPGENEVLAQIYAGALDAAGIPANVAPVASPGADSLAPLLAGTADVVVDYGASLLETVDTSQPTESPDVPKQLAAKLPAGLTLLDASKAADSDALVVTKVTAQKHSLKTIEDLAKVCAQLPLGAAGDFATRPDGLGALKGTYGCTPLSVSTISNSGNALVLALLRDNVLVADIHTSSPAVEENDLVVLEDTKKIWPANVVVPVIATNAVPQRARDVLNKVSSTLSTEDLVALNRLTTGKQALSPAEAAAHWLKDKGLAK